MSLLGLIAIIFEVAAWGRGILDELSTNNTAIRLDTPEAEWVGRGQSGIML